MPILTVNELIDYLSKWTDKDEPIVYTVYSEADIPDYIGEDETSPKSRQLWHDTIGSVDNAMGYAESDINEALKEIYGGQ
jgi:hypothetical protein